MQQLLCAKQQGLSGIISKAHSRIYAMFPPWWSSCIIGVLDQDFTEREPLPHGRLWL